MISIAKPLIDPAADPIVLDFPHYDPLPENRKMESTNPWHNTRFINHRDPISVYLHSAWCDAVQDYLGGCLVGDGDQDEKAFARAVGQLFAQYMGLEYPS